MVFLYKTVHGIIDNPQLLEQISFYTPRTTSRSNVTFSLALAHSNQHLNSPVFAMCKAYNNIPNQIDIFASDIQEFKTVLSGKLRNRMLRIEEQS